VHGCSSPFSPFESARVKPHDPDQPDGRLNLKASAFNQLGLYTSGPVRRRYWYSCRTRRFYRATLDQSRSLCWPTKSWMVWHRDIWNHLSVSLTCLADGLCALQSPIIWQYQLLNCLRSAAERFLFPVLKRGTNYRNKSPLRHLCLPSNVTSRHFYSRNHFRTLLLIDTLVDLEVT